MLISVYYLISLFEDCKCDSAYGNHGSEVVGKRVWKVNSNYINHNNKQKWQHVKPVCEVVPSFYLALEKAASGHASLHPQSHFVSTDYNTCLLLAEFLVRTVNYGPSFFPSIYGPRAKRGYVIYSTDRKDEVNKMLNIWLLPVWGTGNKCRTRKRFDNHFIAVKKESFYWLTKTIPHNKVFPRKRKQIRHVEKVYLVKTKSVVSLSSLM